MAVINVQNWSVEQVVDWITGLDPSLSQYASVFSGNGITGQKLLNLMSGDLEYILGIQRIGDQLIIHEAIQTLRDELQTPWTTLQTLSLALSVRCKNYRSELTQQKQRIQDSILKESEQQSDHHHHHHKSSLQNNLKSKNNSTNNSTTANSLNSTTPNTTTTTTSTTTNNTQTQHKHLETIPTTSLASASYLLDAGKVLIRWLARFPFLGKLNYDEISRKLTKHCFELAVLSQRDSFADNAIEEVQYLCTKIIELCEALIHSSDSLAIQPAGIDVITLRKRNEQDWGLQFESSYWGIHQITGVKLSTPAHQSGHLERGDEILQVNYQTVLAWPQASVISLLHENDHEVILTVKRRPRHASTNLLLLGGHHNNMYLNKLPNRKSFFERKAQREEKVMEEEEEEEIVVVEQQPPLQVVEVVEQAVVAAAPAAQPDDEKSKAEVRFWKLYPKPKYLIKRRATVTGASPTETRPPVTFINDTTSSEDSSGGGATTSPNHHNQVESRSTHAPVHHRRSTPVGTNNSSTLHPPSVHRPPLDKSRSAPETVEESDKQDDEDEVFLLTTSAARQHNNTPPTPKPRLTKPSVPPTSSSVSPPLPAKRESSSSSTTTTVSPPPPTPRSLVQPQPPQQTPRPLVESVQVVPPSLQLKSPEKILPEKELPPVKPLYRGILHIRSQLRKQSSSNSACALPVIGHQLTQTLNSSSNTSSLLCSSSPRWIRQNAVFYSNRELEIINPCNNGSNRTDNLKVTIGQNHRTPTEFIVLPASEVHSRPFAFKITSGESVTYYLAAESQLELDQWMGVMTTGELVIPTSTHSSNVTGSSLSARRNFARAPYKRSISLGSSQSPSTSTHNIIQSSHTPPPALPHHHKPTHPRFYASSTNLAYHRTTRTPQDPSVATPPTRSSSLLNRSKSSSLKTDWFLRNTPSSSNISSITITSKKVVNRSHAVTQYPTPTCTPTKQQQQQPMMGVAMKTKKNSSSTSCSTSPTRKYMCPNCCNVVKVDMGTQTDTPEQVQLVFYNNGGESRV